MKLTVTIDVPLNHVIVFQEGRIKHSFNEEMELEEVVQAMREHGVPIIFSQFDRDASMENGKSVIALCSPANAVCVSLEDENVKLLEVKQVQEVPDNGTYVNWYNVVTLNIYGVNITLRELTKVISKNS